MDWDDYRFFAELAKHASVRGAAKALGVNPSTVTRRLDTLERALGVVLFRRTSQGLNITTEGVEVAHQVEAVADRLRLLETSIKGRDQRLTGAVRAALPDVFAVYFLLADLKPFTAMYPDIELSIFPGYRPLRALATSGVDVLVMPTESPPEHLVGRRLYSVDLGVYAARDADLDVVSKRWITWATQGEMLANSEQTRLRFLPDSEVTLRCDQMEMQRASIEAGLGVGLLPRFVGARSPQLVPFQDIPLQSSPPLWMLTHPASRSVRRIQIFLEFLRDVFESRRGLLAGESESFARSE